MLKIGDFSKLANVTVKTLRLYAELGLLRPTWTDRYTGYRYYTLDQLTRLNRILALKDLGLSLEQVARVLDSRLSPAELRGMLSLKQAELRQKLSEEQQRLARVEARLRQIEQEGQLNVEAVVVRAVDSLLVAYLPAFAPDTAALPARRAQARTRIEAWLASEGVHPPGPWMVIYTAAEYLERDIPFEVAVALGDLPRTALHPPAPLMIRRLPSLPAAAIYHITGDEPAGNASAAPASSTGRTAAEDRLSTSAGSFIPDGSIIPDESFIPALAYAALYTWAEQNGYRACGPARELYLTDAPTPADGLLDPDLDNAPPADFPSALLEVQLPVEQPDYLSSRKEAEMEPEIIEAPEKLIAGTLYEGNNANQEIAVMWEKEYNPRATEIKTIDPTTSYGVCEMDPTLPEGTFRYVAGAEVASPQDVPDGMTLIRAPAGTYAVFKHIGSLDTLSKTYETINQSWIPKSGYRRANRPDLEVYTDAFHDFQPDSILYLWVPVEK